MMMCVKKPDGTPPRRAWLPACVCGRCSSQARCCTIQVAPSTSSLRSTTHHDACGDDSTLLHDLAGVRQLEVARRLCGPVHPVADLQDVAVGGAFGRGRGCGRCPARQAVGAVGTSNLTESNAPACTPGNIGLRPLVGIDADRELLGWPAPGPMRRAAGCAQTGPSGSARLVALLGGGGRITYVD